MKKERKEWLKVSWEMPWALGGLGQSGLVGGGSFVRVDHPNAVEAVGFWAAKEWPGATEKKTSMLGPFRKALALELDFEDEGGVAGGETEELV